MVESIGRKTVRGIKWSTADTVINAILQVGVTSVLARQLDPKSFGLIAISSVILGFCNYFSQMGIGPALVQKKEVVNSDIRAAFTSSVLLGFLFFLITWFLSPMAAIMFNSPALVAVLRAMALSFIISGLSTTSLNLLRREMKFGLIAVVDVASYLIGYGLIGIGATFLRFGVWSLVLAALSQGAITAILSFAFAHHSIIPTFKIDNFKPLYKYGGKVSITGFFEFIGSNIDTVMVGHLLGAVALGLYNKAYMLVTLPVQYLVTSITKVMFPALSAIQNDKVKLKNIYSSTFLILGVIITPISFGMVPASRQIVLTLLGQKWSGTISILQILAVATPFNFLSHIGGIVCDSTANLNIKLKLQSIYIAILVLPLLFLSKYGVKGIAVSILMGEIIRFSFYQVAMKKVLGLRFTESLPNVLSIIIVSFFVTVAIFIATEVFSTIITVAVILLVIQILVGAGMLLFLILVMPCKVLRYEIEKLTNYGGIIPNYVTKFMVR